MKSIPDNELLRSDSRSLSKRITDFSTKLYTSLLDFCFGEQHIADFSVEDFRKKAPLTPPTSHTQTFACLPYQDPVIKKAIFEIKYRKNIELSEIFAVLMLEKLGNIFDKNTEIILTPIPPHKKRLRGYGFSQTLLLCEAMIKVNKIFPNISVRNIIEYQQEGTDHKHMNKSERILHSQNQFILKEEYTNSIKDKTVVIIDDIITTGSTCLDAIRALETKDSKKVIALAVGH